MFRIKICGIRLKNDVEAAEKSPADAVGFNFYHRSVRYLDPQRDLTAELVTAAKRAGLLTVGVFVNAAADDLLRVREGLGLDAIQLHGDEPPSTAERLIAAGYPVIRAVKLPPGRLTADAVEAASRAWLDVGAVPLLDADAGAAHGGSGQRLDWTGLRRWSEGLRSLDWILAGGLSPENVGEAIRRTGAPSVDVASGVESSRGVKSPDKIRAFADAAEAAFAATARGRVGVGH